VYRFRYAPARIETLVNDGGIVTNLLRYRWKWLLLPGFLVAMLWSTWRLVRVTKADVLHAHWLLPQGFAVALLRKIERRTPAFLVTSHGADLFALKAPGFQALKRFVARSAAAMTVVSHAMHDELVKINIDASRVAVRPMGVDLKERFTPDASVERSRDEILFVGRLVEKKGLRFLIEAMPAIVQSHPRAYLTVAGFGPEEAECKARARQLGVIQRINFVGAVSQEHLPMLYRRAAIFVAPFVQASSGDREGLGLVAVEAAGCGCQVIVSDLPAVRDVFEDSEVRFVPPGSVQALVENVCDLLAETSDRQSEKTISSLRAKFDWTVVSRAYQLLLKDVMEGGREG
jgi:glycosyltransferase involved in cell wall biosynthesis